MLDVLEDFLVAREMDFTRIDGGITGRRRQAAIDRFHVDGVVLRLSRLEEGGGVGINLSERAL